MSEDLSSDFVPNEHLSPNDDACSICGHRSDRDIMLTLQASPRVELQNCGSCGAQSASRFPDELFLKQLYAPSDYASDLLTSTHAIENTARHIAKHIPIADRDTTLRVLDYGGGDGSLSSAFHKALRNAGHRGAIELTVVDYFVDERANADVRFLDVTDFAQLTERFDIVIASAVLEHLVDLRWTACKLLSLCEPGGTFYARTPYEAPLAKLVPGYKVRWPRHLHDLGPAFWSKFLTTMGYEGQILRSTPSVVESDFETKPLRTTIAQLMKLPSRLEASLFPNRVGQQGRHLWQWPGGWEVVLRVDGPRG